MKQENWNSRKTEQAWEIPDCEADRFTVKLETRLFPEETSEPVDIVIRDISATGFMAECQTFVRIGSKADVDLAGSGKVQSTIIWALAGRLGGKFNDEVEIGSLAEEYRS